MTGTVTHNLATMHHTARTPRYRSPVCMCSWFSRGVVASENSRRAHPCERPKKPREHSSATGCPRVIARQVESRQAKCHTRQAARSPKPRYRRRKWVLPRNRNMDEGKGKDDDKDNAVPKADNHLPCKERRQRTTFGQTSTATATTATATTTRRQRTCT